MKDKYKSKTQLILELDQLRQHVARLNRNTPDQVKIKTEHSTKINDANLLANMLNSSAQPFAMGTTEGKLIKINQAFCDLTGYSENELLNDVTWNETLTPEKWRKSEGNIVNELLNTGEPQRFDKEYIKKDGSLIFVELLMHVKADSNKNRQNIFRFITNITERKRTEEALLESENKFRSVFENSSIAMTLTDRNGKHVEVNKAALDIFGYTEKELMSMKVSDLTYPGDIDQNSSIFQELWTGERNGAIIEKRYLHKNGQMIWGSTIISTVLNYDGEVHYLLGQMRDITERMLIEEALGESEIKFSDFFENAPIGFHILGPDKKIIEINQTELNMIGYTRDEVVGKTEWSDLIVSEEKMIFEKHWANLLKGELITDFEYTIKHKDGSLRNVLLNGSGRYDADGNLLSTRGSVINITKRKATEKKLIKSEQELRFSAERFHKWMASNFVGIIQSNSKGEIIDANDKLLGMLGYSKQDLLDGKLDWTKLTPSEYIPLDDIAIEEAAERGTWTPFEKEYFHKDGHRVPILIGGSQFKDSPGEFIVFVIDLSKRKKAERERAILEEQLYKSQKMETIGTLAGGITHEINQPLNAISVSANSILYWQRNNPSKLPEIFLDELQQISKGVKRIDEIIRHMRSFWVADHTSQKKPLSLNEVVRDALSLIEQQSAAHGITIEKNFSDQEISILSERVSLEQIVINLVINAMHSLDESGHSDKKIIIETGIEESFCYLSVSDNGTGLPEGDENKVFSPFYSTKDPENSMGLGLAIVKNMVLKMEGSISAANKRPHGAIFTITFQDTGDEE